jgi:hypothetical protein
MDNTATTSKFLLRATLRTPSTASTEVLTRVLFLIPNNSRYGFFGFLSVVVSDLIFFEAVLAGFFSGGIIIF